MSFDKPKPQVNLKSPEQKLNINESKKIISGTKLKQPPLTENYKYNKMCDDIGKLYEPNRDATDTIEGFYFQEDFMMSKLLDIIDGKNIYIAYEVIEDGMIAIPGKLFDIYQIKNKKTKESLSQGSTLVDLIIKYRCYDSITSIKLVAHKFQQYVLDWWNNHDYSKIWKSAILNNVIYDIKSKFKRKLNNGTIINEKIKINSEQKKLLTLLSEYRYNHETIEFDFCEVTANIKKYDIDEYNKLIFKYGLEEDIYGINLLKFAMEDKNINYLSKFEFVEAIPSIQLIDDNNEKIKKTFPKYFMAGLTEECLFLRTKTIYKLLSDVIHNTFINKKDLPNRILLVKNIKDILDKQLIDNPKDILELFISCLSNERSNDIIYADFMLFDIHISKYDIFYKLLIICNKLTKNSYLCNKLRKILSDTLINIYIKKRQTLTFEDGTKIIHRADIIRAPQGCFLTGISVENEEFFSSLFDN